MGPPVRGNGKGVTLPPSFPRRATPSPHRDVILLQTGATVGEHRLKRPQVEVGLPSGLPSQLLPIQVISDREGEDDPLVCTGEERVGRTHL
jgi:hypothetical protein